MSILPDMALDLLGHHAVTCRNGGDVVICGVISLTSVLGSPMEKGNGLTRDLDHTRPGDFLIAGYQTCCTGHHLLNTAMGTHVQHFLSWAMCFQVTAARDAAPVT